MCFEYVKPEGLNHGRLDRLCLLVGLEMPHAAKINMHLKVQVMSEVWGQFHSTQLGEPLIQHDLNSYKSNKIQSAVSVQNVIISVN